MEALSKIQLLVWSKPLPPFNTFFGGSGEFYTTASALSTAMLLPPEAIQRFTIDENFNILCRIDRNYTLVVGAFNNNGRLKNFLIDLDGRMTNSASAGIGGVIYSKLRLLGLTSWGQHFNHVGNPNLVFAPELLSAAASSFHTWQNGMNRLYVPKLTSVGSPILNLFNTSPIAGRKNVMYINSAIASNAGIATAVTRGMTVRVVTNFDTPNKVTDLSANLINSRVANLSFTTPATGTNPIDFYEVWVERRDIFEPENRYLPSNFEVTGTNQIVSYLQPNTPYKLKIATVDTMYNGSGMFKDEIKRAFSNTIEFTTPALSGYQIGMSAYLKLATNSFDFNGINQTVDTSLTYSGGYAKFTNGYVDVADNDALSFTDGTNDTSCHIAFGFIWNSKSGAFQLFLNKRNNSDNLEWQVIATDTIMVFSLISGTSNSIKIEILKSDISTGVLHTLQFSYDGSKNHTGIKAYLNAVSIGTTAMTGTYTGQVNGTSRLRIGATNWDGNYLLKADMKELAIWKNRTMTLAEITDIDFKIKNNISLI